MPSHCCTVRHSENPVGSLIPHVPLSSPSTSCTTSSSALDVSVRGCIVHFFALQMLRQAQGVSWHQRVGNPGGLSTSGSVVLLQPRYVNRIVRKTCCDAASSEVGPPTKNTTSSSSASNATPTTVAEAVRAARPGDQQTPQPSNRTERAIRSVRSDAAPASQPSAGSPVTNLLIAAGIGAAVLFALYRQFFTSKISSAVSGTAKVVAEVRVINGFVSMGAYRMLRSHDACCCTQELGCMGVA